jgi:hypothetical protein
MEVEQAARINEDVCERFGLESVLREPESLRILLASKRGDDVIEYASSIMYGTIALESF